MMRRALVLSLYGLTVVCGSAGSAWAVPQTWTLFGVMFDDGGTASGSFTFDPDTNTYSAVNVTTTSGASRTGATFAFVCTAPCTGIAPPGPGAVLMLTTSSAGDQTGLPGMSMRFQSPLSNVPDKGVAIDTGLEATCSDAGCSNPVDPVRRIIAGHVVTVDLTGGAIPTLSEWGTILLVLSLLAVGTWRLAGGRAR
jgi:hypothetical protein